MPEGEGRYTPEEAWEEAEKMKEAVKSGEASDYVEAEKVVKEKFEKELSSEVIEKILEKVRDIFTPGTGYQAGRAGDTENILKYGLLPQEMRGKKHRETDLTFQESFEKNKSYKKAVEALRDPVVFFNITGRHAEGHGPYGRWPGRTILFDPSYLQETAPTTVEDRWAQGRKLPRRTFSADWQPQGWMTEIKTPATENAWKEIFGDLEPGDPRIKESPYYSVLVSERALTPDGYPNPTQEYGFTTNHRVSPKHFLGIIDGGEEVKELVKMMIDSDVLLPLYSRDGEVKWPKKMSHEEVKRFVEERDAKEE